MQLFKTEAQWASGLLNRLEMVRGGGITLYSTPTLSQWIEIAHKIKNPDGLEVDGCGEIYIIDKKTCRLHRYDPGTHRLEQLSCIGGCGSEPGQFRNPARIVIDPYTLWVVDTGNHRVQAFSRDNYQIKHIIKSFKEPVDIGLDLERHFYVLDRKLKKILKYEPSGHFIQSFGQEHLKEPVGLAVGKGNILNVIDREYGGFLKFTEHGEYLGIIGDFTEISKEFQPLAIVINRKGSIFVGDEKSGQIHQFDSDGSYIGTVTGFSGPIQGLAVDWKGDLYASSKQGIAFMSCERMSTKESGVYYSRTLDSGIHQCQWHRLAFEADLPPRTVIDVYYFSCDDSGLERTINRILSDPDKSDQEKCHLIDTAINTWIGPEKKPKDLLFREKTGRYLWLKVVLSTFEEKVRPTLRQMQVYYPRISYLRYLPTVYQEDAISKDFLERFLSIFETVFYGLETEIGRVYKYFDPDIVPQHFLSWLGSWLNLAVEEDWPEDKKRTLIREAASLFKLKGTPAGIRGLIEIYTEKTPLIIESSRIGEPMVVGGNFVLGLNGLLIQTPIRGFRLGDDSILGRVALRDIVQSPEDPFLQQAHRFTVILALSSEELARYEKGLKRILNKEKPAHTTYHLRVINDMRVGVGMYVGRGISPMMRDYRPMQIGLDTTLGSGLIAFDSGETCGKIGIRSKVQKDTKLI